MSLPSIIVRSGEGLTIEEACRELKLSERTLRRWNAKHRIACRVSRSRLLLSYPALLMITHGDHGALEQLRSGNRADPRVKQYLETAGVQGNVP